MFFHRAQEREYTFSDRLSLLREAGFQVREQGETRAVVRRDGCAAVVEHTPGRGIRIGRAGLVVAGEIAELVCLGYQTVWETASGRQEPARASELHTLHEFEEDLRYRLGLPSLFNESLGPVSDRHQYDRLAGRS